MIVKCSEASSGVNLAFFNTWTTSSLLRVIKTHRHLSFSLLMRFGTFLGIFLLEYKLLCSSCILEFQMLILIQIWVSCFKQERQQLYHQISAKTINLDSPATFAIDFILFQVSRKALSNHFLLFLSLIVFQQNTSNVFYKQQQRGY